MATATKKRPKGLKGTGTAAKVPVAKGRPAAKKQAVPDPLAIVPAAPAAADLRERIAAATEKRDGIKLYDREAIAAAEAGLVDLRHQLTVAELTETPLPKRATWQFDEQDVRVEKVVVTGNHRDGDDDVETLQLMRTIDAIGLQQRVGLRATGGGEYELIFGSRRLAAFKRLGRRSIPAKVYPQELTPADVEFLRTIENVNRRGLTPVELAIAVDRNLNAVQQTIAGLAEAGETKQLAELQRAIEEAGGPNGYVGQRLGFPAKWVQDHAFVHRLGGTARALLAARRLDVGHARQLAKLGDPAAADYIAGVCSRNAEGQGGQSVDFCRQQVNQQLRSLRIVPWQLGVAFGQGTPGCTGLACDKCPFNSETEPDLFGDAGADFPAGGHCTNETCFKAKQQLTEAAIVETVAAARERAKGDAAFAPTESYVAHVNADFVKLATATRRVKKELGGETPSPSDGSAPARQYTPYQESPESKARREHYDAVRAWGQRLWRSVGEAVTEPTRVLALAAYAVHPHRNTEGDEGAATLRLLLANDAAGLAQSALSAGEVRVDDYETENVASNALERLDEETIVALADAWGVSVGPRPVEPGASESPVAGGVQSDPAADGSGDNDDDEQGDESGMDPDTDD